MVLPAKIFEIKEEVHIKSIFQSLKNFREEVPFEMNGNDSVNLLTDISNLNFKGDRLIGEYNKDFINRRIYRGEVVETPITEKASFWIKSFENRIFIIIQAPSGTSSGKKLITNHVANKISGILFDNSRGIIETKISHETLKSLHESNPEATKLIWFDDVNIPGINKLCLAGSNLADTNLYNDYLNHGKIWYVVFQVQKHEIVIGITRNCVVTLFSKSTITDFLNYILDDVLKLVE